MMMKGLGLDESMSNLTSTVSGETSISSNARNESSSTTTNTNTMLYPQASSSSFASQNQAQQPLPPPAKKKRSLPGNPDPDAEVIALSPKSLLATNRFICEICNKGFQRDQNLQLHRRGHNLPWKLKQRANKEQIRKKVYVCPEPTCVHHDPSRALGDLTGVKKHFCRKHGEKKWKCEKCSKKYAVQSDWKAHSKICGTREYRCDCGTLFSRRDSFITHRAFCDALAEESARAINPLTVPAAGLAATSTSTTLPHFSLPPHMSSHHHALQSLPPKREQDQHLSFPTTRPDIPPWLACPPPQPAGLVLDQQHHAGVPAPPAQMGDVHQHMYSFQHQYDGEHHSHHQQHDPNSNPTLDHTAGAGPTLSSFHAPPPPQMSATALLQKAAEMGVTVSNHHRHHQQNQHQLSPHGLMVNNKHQHHQTPLTDHHQQQQQQQLTSSNTGGFLEAQVVSSGSGGAQSSMLHDMMIMSSLQSTASGTGYDGSAFGDFHHHHHQGMTAPKPPSRLDGGGGNGSNSGGGGSGGDGLTRDFLGLRTFSHKDFLNMAGLGHMNSSSASFDQQNDHHHQTQTPW